MKEDDVNATADPRTTAPTRLHRRCGGEGWRAARVVAFGAAAPAATAAVAAGVVGIAAPMRSAALLAVLLAASPLPLSVPGVALGDARDDAADLLAARWPRWVAALLALPWLASSPDSPRRPEAIASLLGFAAAAGLAGPHLLVAPL